MCSSSCPVGIRLAVIMKEESVESAGRDGAVGPPVKQEETTGCRLVLDREKDLR